MEKQKAFDLAKKLLDGGDIHQGYRMNDGRLYPAYYTNEEWEAFLADMKTNYPAAFKGYDEGKGGELEEHNFKGKKIPPKMASYSSSSRSSTNYPGTFLVLSSSANSPYRFPQTTEERQKPRLTAITLSATSLSKQNAMSFTSHPLLRLNSSTGSSMTFSKKD